jgi:hypothetical protein
MSTICLGMLLGLPHLGMASWGCICSPQHKTRSWRKAAASLRHTGQSGGAPDSLVPLSGASSLWNNTAGDRWHAGFLHRTVRCSFLRQSHLELAVGLLFLVHRTVRRVAPDSPVLQTRQSTVATLSLFLGLHLIFIMSSFEVLLSSLP